MVVDADVVPPGSVGTIAPLPAPVEHRLRSYDEQCAGGFAPPGAVCVLTRTDAEVDVALLDEAFGSVWWRHDALRLRFGLDPPTCHVDDAAAAPRAGVADRRRAGTSGTDFETWFAHQSVGSFDFLRGPLVRPFVVRQSAGTSIGFTADHLVIDLASFRILLYEVSCYYEARHLGRTCDLEPPPFQYSAYLAHRERRLDAGLRAGALKYLRQRGTDVRSPPPLPLPPLERPPGPPVQREIERMVPRDVDAAVQSYAKSLRTTPFVVWLAFLASSQATIAMERGIRQRAFGAAVPLQGRSLRGAEKVIGNFINTAFVGTLPLEYSLDGVVEDVRDQMVAALQYQDVTLFDLEQDLVPDDADPTAAPYVYFNGMSTRRPVSLTIGGCPLEIEQGTRARGTSEVSGLDVYIDFGVDQSRLWACWADGQYEEAGVARLLDLMCSAARQCRQRAT